MLKVLIIDDELDICYLLGNILRQRNFYIEFVNTLYDAKQALLRIAPEIIFLDNHLPDGVGVSLIAYIKKSYPLIKIIMITAHDSEIEKNIASREGVDFFIGKPFTKDTVCITVDKIVG